MGYTQQGDLVELFDPDLAREAVHDMADVGGDWLLVRVIDNTPVSYHNRALEYQGFAVARAPGTLKRSWYRLPTEHTVRGVNRASSTTVATDDSIAPFVEWDTKPHDIHPKTPGGRLRFRTWPTGELVYAKMVRHPGTHGQHMMALAVHAAELNFETIVDGPLHEWARRQEAKAR